MNKTCTKNDLLRALFAFRFICGICFRFLLDALVASAGLGEDEPVPYSALNEEAEAVPIGCEGLVRSVFVIRCRRGVSNSIDNWVMIRCFFRASKKSIGNISWRYLC